MTAAMLLVVLLGMISAVSPQTTGVAPPQATGTLYPIAGTRSNGVDDGSSPRIDLQRPFMYFGRQYNQIYVNHNGHLTFNSPWNRYIAQRFPLNGARDLIAPFWTDLDNRLTGQVYYNQYTDDSVLAQATQDINRYFPGLNFNANWVFVATWYEVAYFPNTGTQTTAQAVLISGGQFSFVLMNYGAIAATTRHVQAGYDTINSTNHFTIPGSFTRNATGPNSNFRLSSNVNVPSRWAFRVDHGLRGCTFNGVSVALGVSFWSDSTCAQRCTCTSAGLQCNNQHCTFSQVCRPAEFQFSCQTVPRGICTIWHDPHHRTFDNKIFTFSGTCTYVLSEQCSLGLPYYRVEGKNEHRGTTRVSWPSLAKIYVYDDVIEIVRNQRNKAKVNGIFANTPFFLNNGTVHVYTSGRAVVVSTDFGLTVSYNAHNRISIEVPFTYQNATCGLCGNFNGDSMDDFRTPQGAVVTSVEAFANSWKALGANETDCDNGCEGPGCVGCTEAQTVLYSNAAHCGLLLSNPGPFAACHERIPPQPFVQTCASDVCADQGHQPILCEAIAVYASLCQRIGIQLPNWRREGFCEIQCPANSHFESQGTGCPATCVNPNSAQNCPLPTQESCICNSSYILSAGVCVTQAECGCSFEGRYYRAGETVILDNCGRRCTCNNGSMNCSPHVCGPHESCRVVQGEFGCHPNPHGTCRASGDPHYTTFDHKRYDFMGTCRYVLATPCNAADEHQYSVEAKNNPAGRVSYTADVFVKVLGYEVHLPSTGGVVQVNGVTQSLPILLNGSVSVYRSGSVKFVTTDFGLSVSYIGSTVTVTVPPSFSGKTCGLCGNFNGNRSDEYQTPSGMLVTTPQEFGTSWKVADNSTCSDGCGSSCPQCTNEQPARAKCQVIQAADGPLSFCHSQVDPAPFFSNCVYDVCVVGDGFLCTNIEAYVSACHAANVNVLPWRENTNCTIDCHANSHYELCGTDCGHTCASNIDATCESLCTEGCFCDQGFVRSGTECVLVENCGCQYDGFYYQADESFWKEGCTELCKCSSPNNLVCFATSCPPVQTCTIRNGQRGCFDDMSSMTAFGDPHYLTFDGAVAHFQGTCSYIIVESVNHTANEIHFQVVATNNHRGNNRVSFVSAVDVYLSNQTENVHVRIGANRRVKINGSALSLPATIGTLAQVVRQGSYIVVSAADLAVHFDGISTLLLRVDRRRQNRVRGMAGNFNDDPTDDKVLPNGTMARNDYHFGQSWKSPTSQPGCGSTDVNVGDALTDCRFREEYSELCGVITNSSGPFRTCHLHVDPQPFFDSCVYDLCLASTANDMLCSAVAAYEKACSVLGLNITEWRPALQCADPSSDPCEPLNCTEYEWCGVKDGVHGCFCDEHHRPNSETCDSSITCVSSTGIMSLSRCQLFERGFHLGALHLRDESCTGTLEDGRLVFTFNNEDKLCGTSLRSNGTHIIYENAVLGVVDPNEGQISRERSLHLHFTCQYPLTQDLSMAVGINPVESVVRKNLPSGQGQYDVRMIPYQDSGFRFPLVSEGNIQMEIDERMYVELRTEGVDGRQIAAIVDSCWATPVNIADYPVRWNLINDGCPNPADGTVTILQNGVSTVARFSFRMFTFTNHSSIFLHCQVHLCLLSTGNCSPHCFPGYHNRVRRDVSLQASTEISLGPFNMMPRRIARMVNGSGALGPLSILVTLLVSFLTAKILV